MELPAYPEPPLAEKDRSPRGITGDPREPEWQVATSLWPIAWPGIVFWFLQEALGAWAKLSEAALSSGITPGYWVWSASEHTSRTALALTLLLWAIIRPSIGPTYGSAPYD